MGRYAPRVSRRHVLAGAASLAVGACASSPGLVGAGFSGDDTFVFDGWAGPALNVFGHAPGTLHADTPLVVVMHGQGRNASEYRDQWSEAARRSRFVIIAPEFSRTDFPEAAHYNLGNRYDEAGRPVPRDRWSFSAIEPMVDAAIRRYRLNATSYALYGHSAGAQFVHRFMLHMPDARVSQAMSANAGWYTLPDLATPPPFGAGEPGVSEQALKAWLAKPMTILLGTLDTDTEQSSLNRSPEAMIQGPHRLARGRYFFETGRSRAEALDTAFRWRLAYAPNINHDNSRMVPHAVPYLVG